MWIRVIVGAVCLGLAVLGLGEIRASLVDEPARTSRSEFIRDVALAVLSALVWLGVLSLPFCIYTLKLPITHMVGLVFFTAFFAGLGCVAAAAGALLVYTAFRPVPNWKWLREMKQMREALQRRRADSSSSVANGPAGGTPEMGEEGLVIEEDVARLAEIAEKISIDSLDPRELAGGRLWSRVQTALLFSRAGRLPLGVLFLVQAAVVFSDVPAIARGGEPWGFEHMVEYGQGIVRGTGTLYLATMAVLAIVLLPAGLAWQEDDHGRPTIRKRSTRWLVALAGYGAVISLIVGISLLGWMSWLLGQVRDAWQHLVALPF